MKRPGLFSAAAFLSLAAAVPARAYIDPGTGSYVFQVLIGIFVGALFSIKIFWRKLRTSLSSLFKQKHDRTP
jgi:hypothetical protein